jgi:hypothetical protein
MLDEGGNENARTFHDLLAEWREAPSAGTEDVLGAALPLIEQVAALHEQGLIAPLNGVDALRVSMGHLWFPNDLASEPETDERALQAIEGGQAPRLDVTGRYSEQRDGRGVRVADEAIAKAGETEPRRAYYPGYFAWEQEAGHHDQLSDIFVLGLILTSLALRRDLTSVEDLPIFVQARSDLMRHNPRLHPVLSRIAAKMTELDRRKRPQDLRQIANALAHYREQDTGALETSGEPVDLSSRVKVRQHLHEKLRERLFEINRRNRLIYFRETSATVNLTVGSMPNVIDPGTVKPQQLFYLNGRADLKKPIDLNAWLQFQDYGFLAASLDRIRLDAQHDAREYGFSQLRLVVAFLRWTNLKEAPDERIDSPLILVPATLLRRKGVKDSFRLDANPAEAEINPALRYYLRSLYDIRLPETVDASDMEAIHALHADLARQLEQSATGIELALIDTPRIMLVQRTARRKLDDFRRRAARTSAGIKDYGGIAYSYGRPNYEPLGVQIFERDIRVARAPAHELAETGIKPRVNRMVAALEEAEPAAPAGDEVKELDRTFYAVDRGAGGGSHAWEMDLCAVTLANFNYRKMTLVRDYSELTGSFAYAHSNFDLLFSDEGRRSFEPNAGAKSDFMVLPADPSQAEAVARAGTGESYVIQGPPGTGKSQTITNLIADYVARGRGVLFVCEKRAALDVVFHRLKQSGLGDVSTLIHDSQGDKKAFIEELKGIYESWTSKKPREDVAKQREALTREIAGKLAELDRFSSAMTAPVDAGGPPLRDLIEARLQHGADSGADVPARVKAALPGWQAFQAAKPALQMLRDALISSGYDGILARAPIRLLRGDLAQSGDAAARVERALPRLKTALGGIGTAAADMEAFLGAKGMAWEDMLQLGAFCRVMAPIAAAGRLAILDAGDPSAEKLITDLQKLAKLEAAAAGSEATSGWPKDADVPDVAGLIAAAQKNEGRFLAFLSGEWRRAKRAVRTHYTGSHPSVAGALLQLADMLRTAAIRDRARASMQKDCGFEVTPAIQAALERAWTAGSELTDIERDAIEVCLAGASGAASRAVQQLSRQSAGLKRVEDELGAIFVGHARLTHEAIAGCVEELEDNTGQIAEFAGLLAELDKTEPKVSQALRVLDMPFEEIEVAVLDNAIGQAFRRNRALDRFDSAKLEELVDDLKQRNLSLRKLNSQFAVNASHQEFHSDLTKSNEPTVGLTREEGDWRRDFRRGRKTLENEFQKSRAHKSIRELFAGEAGRALRLLKPVWLMSPLSVADILPLEEKLFDVVIFDEASQIPLEDAIPALYRSRQMIVVGDEMQLPPSQFFAGHGAGEEDEGAQQDLFVYDLNADSFLNRAAAALPHVLLAWHYRSQHEALIQFCNKAFYKGELQTIPSVAELPKREPVRVKAADDAKTLAAVALDQPLSFHRMENSPYEAQRNPGEAAYIAQLVREILLARKGLSIGVVAFSQAQQAAIESALNALAANDRDFRAALDKEEEREEDGQFVGLFVKNLENVQGDERDVIILSVCYGPGSNGRMLMNFGPINQNGGEKRLNVIFSRAKRHMMVVSSIEGAQITNTYNTGANALRKYLTYAQAASVGDTGAMAAALAEYASANAEEADGDGQIVADQIADELTARGFVAVRNYGHSGLKCHIAVKKAGRGDTGDFRLAIQIDDRAHYGNTDLAARYVVKPGILGAFGWEVMTVLAKDWHTGRDKVMERIVSRLR